MHNEEEARWNQRSFIVELKESSEDFTKSDWISEEIPYPRDSILLASTGIVFNQIETLEDIFLLSKTYTWLSYREF